MRGNVAAFSEPAEHVFSGYSGARFIRKKGKLAVSLRVVFAHVMLDIRKREFSHVVMRVVRRQPLRQPLFAVEDLFKTARSVSGTHLGFNVVDRGIVHAYNMTVRALIYR